jgi:hypothetical protein
MARILTNGSALEQSTCPEVCYRITVRLGFREPKSGRIPIRLPHSHNREPGGRRPVKQNARDLKRLTEEQLTQLILDIDLEQNMRDSEGKPTSAKRRKESPTGSVGAMDKRDLIELRVAAMAEARKRGVSILPAAPEEKQQRSQALARMLAKAHRGVAEERISAPTGIPKSELREQPLSVPIGFAHPQKYGEQPKAIDDEEHKFSHSSDYRSIRFLGKEYTLTANQAHVIKMLHEAHLSGTPAISGSTILESLGTPSGRLRDTFKRSLLWGQLVARGAKKGTYRINLAVPPQKQAK